MFEKRDENTQAEINNDRFINGVDQELEELNRSKQLVWARDELLAGRKVYTFGAIYDLNEYIINKYSEHLNPEYDFVEGYGRNDIEPDLRRLVEREADYLASKVLGES